MIMTHQFWTKKFKGVEQHLKTTYLGPGEKPGEKELLTFNAKSFRSDVQYESLSLRAKTILTQPTWLRTDEDLQYIYRYTASVDILLSSEKSWQGFSITRRLRETTM